MTRLHDGTIFLGVQHTYGVAGAIAKKKAFFRTFAMA